MKMVTVFFLLAFFCYSPVYPAQRSFQDNKATHVRPAKQLTLAKAVMCERIDGYVPYNPSIVFPTALEKVSCFTAFDPVPEKTVIYHNWFYKDKLSTRIKLSLQPPRWSTFSSIQLREADKGPWRVEITDDKGLVFRVLRFSITD